MRIHAQRTVAIAYSFSVLQYALHVLQYVHQFFLPFFQKLQRLAYKKIVRQQILCSPVTQKSRAKMAKQQPLCGGIIRAPRYFWIYTLVLQLCYGFIKEFKPAEAYLVAYLTNATDGKNISVDVVNSQVNPYWTYSYLVATVFVFLFTDILRYNPMIIIECTAYLTTRIVAIWGESVFAMKMMYVSYGIATGAEVGYFSYVYTVVPPKYYERVTGPVRAARMFGTSLSCFIGQALFSTFILDYTGMCYFSLVSVCIAMFLALLLPWYFSCPCGENRYSHDLLVPRSCTQTITQTFANQFHDFMKFYSQPSLLKWSVWWATAMCGMFQVTNYTQSLWVVIAEETGMVSGHKQWNGLVVGFITLGQSLGSLVTSILRMEWALWGEFTMGGLALVDCALLVVASRASALWIAYICVILFISSQAFMITISS